MTNAAQELLEPPGVAAVLPLAIDGRTAALRRLALFISLLRLWREGDRGGPPVEFRVPLENVLTDWPDSEKDFRLPAVAFAPGAGQHVALGLGGGIVCEESVGKFGPNTVVEQLGEYVEQLSIEAWGHSRAERAGVVAGLKAAFQSAAASYAIRLRLPDYFDQIATFVFDESAYVEEPDAIRGRRRALLKTTLRVPDVRLVAYPSLRPIVEIQVADRGHCADPNEIVEIEI